MNHKPQPRELLTVEEYLALSAKINYQLNALRLNKMALLALVIGSARYSERERDILIMAFDVLQAGYGDDRRRLGTPGILHPLRAAAILTRATSRPNLLHILTALLHDKQEDLTETELGTERWQRMQHLYERMDQELGEDVGKQLRLRIDALSNVGLEGYEQYLGQVLDGARQMPDLLHVKLADRLDNTFDIHLQHPGVTGFNFYRAVFDILFVPTFRGVDMGSFHFMPNVDEGVMLLSQLFKNTEFLALLRHHGLDRIDEPTHRLFVGLAVASIREAQWLALEMFNTCLSDVQEQRELLKEVMDYCSQGGLDVVTARDDGDDLDGMIFETFRAELVGQRKRRLTELFQDHRRLAKMVLAFIAVYASFINNPNYSIRGIDREGVRPSSR